MPRSAAMASSSCWTVAGSAFERTIRSILAPRLRIASSKPVSLFGRRQRAAPRGYVDSARSMPSQRLAVGAARAGVRRCGATASGFRSFERFDRPPRHRLGDGVTDVGKFGAEGRDRGFDMIGILQRLDLAGDLDQMPFQRGKIRACGGGSHRRRGAIGGGGARAARRHRPCCGSIELVLTRGDFGDREIHRGRADRREG